MQSWRSIPRRGARRDESIAKILLVRNLQDEPFRLSTQERRVPCRLTHTLTPRPDKTLIISSHHVIVEHDCGEETIELSNIIRDATIARKHLVYDQLERSRALDDLGCGPPASRSRPGRVPCARPSDHLSQRQRQRCAGGVPQCSMRRSSIRPWLGDTQLHLMGNRGVKQTIISNG